MPTTLIQHLLIASTIIVLTACGAQVPAPHATPAVTPTPLSLQSNEGHFSLLHPQQKWLAGQTNTLTLHLADRDRPLILAADIDRHRGTYVYHPETESYEYEPPVYVHPLYPDSAHISPYASLYLYPANPVSDTITLAFPAHHFEGGVPTSTLRLVLTSEIVGLPAMENKDVGPQKTITRDQHHQHAFLVRTAGEETPRGFSNHDEFAEWAYLFYPLDAVVDSLILEIGENGGITPIPSSLVNVFPSHMSDE
jgi:hypothetical protein